MMALVNQEIFTCCEDLKRKKSKASTIQIFYFYLNNPFEISDQIFVRYKILI